VSDQSTPVLAPSPHPAVEFDAFAARYEEALHAGLSASGESADYFARGRAQWVTQTLNQLNVRPASVLDFGCGTGSSVPHLLRFPGCERVHGVDVSEASLAVARKTYGAPNITFASTGAPPSPETIDLAFCNGVFHHIAPSERARAVAWVWRSLRPGGLFAFWENNPWNPGTRFVMSRIPFDRDAITLTPFEARALLRAGGFDILRTDFLFIFPAFLRWLRWLERPASALPLGAQYLVLVRKARDTKRDRTTA
jgi:SAM-dependent methyltransferase